MVFRSYFFLRCCSCGSCLPGVIVCFRTVSGSGAIVGEDIPGRTTIGCNNIIGHHAVVGVKCQDMKYKVSFFLC